MASHFLLSAKARTLTLATVLRMTDLQAEATFAAIRWPETDGRAVCPACACPTCYECRRPNGALRFRCKACRKDFSLTSGTLFAHHKLPLQTYLAAVVIFCNEVKGKSALALSRDLGVQYKTAFVLSHKLREAMATEVKGYKLGGVGRTVEVDGAYFGGYAKPANHRENRRDRRLLRNLPCRPLRREQRRVQVRKPPLLRLSRVVRKKRHVPQRQRAKLKEQRLALRPRPCPIRLKPTMLCPSSTAQIARSSLIRTACNLVRNVDTNCSLAVR